MHTHDLPEMTAHVSARSIIPFSSTVQYAHGTHPNLHVYTLSTGYITYCIRTELRSLYSLLCNL